MSRVEEEDEEVKSVLIESLTVVSMDTSDDETASKGSSSTRSSKKFSLHSFLGDKFMEGFCTPEFVPGGPCVVPTDCTQQMNCARPRMNSRDEAVKTNVTTESCSVPTFSTFWVVLPILKPLNGRKSGIKILDLSKPTRANLKSRMRRIRELRNSAHTEVRLLLITVLSNPSILKKPKWQYSITPCHLY